jgi:hypothetical protein
VSITTEGTHTLLFWSTDAAGNVEATKTATVRLDLTNPSVPTSVSASAVSTTSIELRWAAATDAVSGVAYYGIYRSGSLVGTTTALVYTDSGLSAASGYSYWIRAFDAAGNLSAQSATTTGTTPAAEIWMSMATDTVDMGAIAPGLASTLTSATTVRIGGVGGLTYDFYSSATDFSNSATSSITPTMPVGTLAYTASGYVNKGITTFTAVPTILDTSVGNGYVWQHDYRFDYILTVPWAFDPGTYTTTVTYTVVSR